MPTHLIDPKPVLIHADSEMGRIVEMAEKVAPSDANILILGESGTGKSLLARVIHGMSRRSDLPFVTLGCANVAEDLLESELFGHEKGAFTGAGERRIGKFEQASGGTIFLDEVSELGPRLQGKLLRVVQERAFERLAGEETIQVDVRILASSSADLDTLAREDRFRKDLYYRLNVIAIRLPALRERPEDIPVLAGRFLAEAAERHHRQDCRLAPEAEQLLRHHSWPGNVRELRNVLEGAVIATTGEEIQSQDLPITTIDRTDSVLRSARAGLVTLNRLEEAYIREVLRVARGNKTEAAKILGINRKTLLEKRKRYGIE